MKSNQVIKLLKGEYALPQAPKTEVSQGKDCIPQHYLTFQHDLNSVEEVIFDVFYSERYPIFVSQEEACIYLQVGIVGKDNYKASSKEKLVYGRKWRVEPNLPTSEIVQTAFLAIKIAREHEVRELFRYKDNGHTTTPFNSHHDLPLLSQCREELLKNTPEFVDIECIARCLSKIDYCGCRFHPNNLKSLGGSQHLLTINVEVVDPKIALPELSERQQIHLVISSTNLNHILHALMDELLNLSNRHVSEHFQYNQFTRFSWDNDVQCIADISAKTRQLHTHPTQAAFEKIWREQNNDVDYSRAPALNDSRLGGKLQQQIDNLMPLEGHLPQQVNRSI